jgi:hypothetical protein
VNCHCVQQDPEVLDVTLTYFDLFLDGLLVACGLEDCAHGRLPVLQILQVLGQLFLSHNHPLQLLVY